jgi:predicted transcriptional regulator
LKKVDGKYLSVSPSMRRLSLQAIALLSKALNRDYKNVHQDVTALISAGLIDDHDGLRAEYDAIEMKMAL